MIDTVVNCVLLSIIHTECKQEAGLGRTQQEVSHLSRPSWAAAPPGMILVMKMLGSSPTWGLSVPPAMLKPRPEFPCNKRRGGREKKKKRSWRVKAAHRLQSDQRGVNKARANKELHHHCTHSFQCDLLVFDLPLRAVDLSRNGRSSLRDNCTLHTEGRRNENQANLTIVFKAKPPRASSATESRPIDRYLLMFQLFGTAACAERRGVSLIASTPPPPSPPLPLHFQLLSHTSASPLQLSRSRGRRGANLRNFRRSFGTDLENNFSGPCSGSQKNGGGGFSA